MKIKGESESSPTNAKRELKLLMNDNNKNNKAVVNNTKCCRQELKE